MSSPLYGLDASEIRLDSGDKLLKQKHLVNNLNYLNFSNRTINVNFRHLTTDTILTLRARPLPCTGDRVDCAWEREERNLKRKLKSYRYLNFSFDDGQFLFVAYAGLERLSGTKISLCLPKAYYQFSSRRLKHHRCSGIDIQVIRNHAVFRGEVVDFNSFFFRAEFPHNAQPFPLLDLKEAVRVIIRNKGETVYSGECAVIRSASGPGFGTLVLEPLRTRIQRFRPKQFRSIRYEPVPPPHIVFRHPIINKLIKLGITNLSASGVLVEERKANPVLLPGMIIPAMELEFAAGFTITCPAQVLYRNAPPEGDTLQCGIAFIDLAPGDQVRLATILHRAHDRKANACGRVDPDDLWNFFFRTGFFYAKKYDAVCAQKDKLRQTYEKLYLDSPTVTRHFIQQDKETIQGHISMVRFYENTWMFHHHAADPVCFGAGIAVLDQIIRHVNDFYALPSANMDYMMGYYRPENRFPQKVFGGFIPWLKDKKCCSRDDFAYVPMRFRTPRKPGSAGAGYALSTARHEDLADLAAFYEKESGGLMLHAIDLDPGMQSRDTLSREYQKAGLKRERHIFSLKKDGRLKAFFMVNVSDIGLNLSNLTNCIHAFVVDPDDLPAPALISALTGLSTHYEQEEIPVLIYPKAYADSSGIPYKRLYTLWTFSTQCSDDFLRYIEGLLKRHKTGISGVLL